jgi:hypothetical protein
MCGPAETLREKVEELQASIDQVSTLEYNLVASKRDQRKAVERGGELEAEVQRLRMGLDANLGDVKHRLEVCMPLFVVAARGGLQ